MTDSRYNLSQQHALETNPSVSILSCVGESTASRAREATLLFPVEVVSPPGQEGFDILEEVQWRTVLARTEVSPRSHCVFQFPKGKGKENRVNPFLKGQ